MTCALSRSWKEPVWLGLLENTEVVRGPFAALAGITSLIGNLIFRLLGPHCEVMDLQMLCSLELGELLSL